MDFVGNKIYKCGDELTRIYKCGEIVWEKSTERDYSKEYLTCEMISAGTFTITRNGAENDVQYSINGGEWMLIDTGTTLNVSSGDVIRFKATEYTEAPNIGIPGVPFIAYGNIMSLLYGDNFVDNNVIPEAKTNAFSYLFNYSRVVSAENLVMPATILRPNTYLHMFFGCTSLTTAPALPATTLAEACYREMFFGCESLITAPALPATTLTNDCYYGMFYNCISLTAAPSLPATTLAEACYSSMFLSCTSLTQAPDLPATTLAENCYVYMFRDCTKLTGIPQTLPATTLTANCYYGMFYNCISLTTAPELPATTLANFCYEYMFFGCESLTTTPELPATTLAAFCYSHMFEGCESLTTTPELPATTLASSCYDKMLSKTGLLPDLTNIDFNSRVNAEIGALQGLFAGTPITYQDLENILPKNQNNKPCLPRPGFYGGMFKDCTSLTTAPELPLSIVDRCYEYMFQGCTSLTAAPALPATALANYCYQYMFDGCTSLTQAPDLPATTLANYCYYRIFRGCTNLNYIKCLATNISARYCTTGWVSNVSSTGTFVKATGSSWTTGNSGIPSNWTIEEV